MNPLDQTLVRKLAIVLVIKLAVLVGLWWVFVREYRVTPQESSVATQLLGSGNSESKEKCRD
ncbi:MAG: cytochrome oxidase putative small subunit CydP [Tepidimonas sp.]|uniref:cytochrome oxidase putative small subunit CydP n=1 Tax=Tepidimonas sp. TaxID=2002775 RepID=UPI0040552919